jgi:hypothetical protein
MKKLYIRNNHCIEVINPNGKMKQLNTAFKVVIEKHNVYARGISVFVEEVKISDDKKLMFLVLNNWMSYQCFRIP